MPEGREDGSGSSEAEKERKRLDEVSRHRAELDALQATVLDITGQQELSTLLYAIVERSVQLLKARSGAMYMCDPERKEVRLTVGYETSRDFTGTVLKYGEGAAGIAAQTEKPVILDDYRKWQGRALVFEQESPFTAVLSVPMIWKGRIVGVIDVMDDVESRRFTQEDQELLTLFANHAAIAVQRQQTEQKLRLQSEIAENMFEGVVLTRASDGVIVYANPHFEKMFGYGSGELIGKKIATMNAPTNGKSPEDVYGEIQASLNIHGLWNGEVHNARKDGTSFWCRANISTLETSEYGRVWVETHEDITERKQMEDEIRNLARFPSENPNPVLRLDKEGRVLTANQASKALLEEWNCELGQTAPRFWRDLVTEVLSTGQSRNLDIEFGDRYYTFLVRPIVETSNVNFYGRDITERKRAEEALRESESRYRALFDNASDAILIHDIGGKFLEANHVACERLGYSREELLQMTPEDINSPEYAAHVAERVEEVRKLGHAFFEIAHMRRDGTVIPIELSSRIIEYKGRPAVLSIARDITERKLAEQKLRLQSEITENMFEGVHLTRASDGVIVYTNPRFEQMFGYGPGELIGKSTAVVNAPVEGKSSEDTYTEIETSLNESGAWVGEIRNVKKDGTLFWCRANVSALESSEYGRIWVSVQEDITESKRTAEKLDAMHKHSAQLGAENNIDEIVTSTLDAMEHTLGFHYAGFEEVKDGFVQIKKARGIPASLEPLPLDGPGIVVKVARTKETIRISDTRSEPKFVDTKTKSPSGQPVRMLSELAVPVVVNGSVVAVLNVESTRLGAFTESDQVLLETLAMHVSSAIARLEQMEALRSRAEELDTLQATVLDITAPYDLSTLLERIVERAARLLGAASGGMYLCDPEKREARCVVSYNTPHDYRGVVLKYGEGAAGRVAETRRPLIVNDYRLWEGRAEVYEKDRPFSALLSAPMIWQDRVIGVIHVMEESKARRFTQADLEMLILFANHATIAVERTRTEEELKQYSLHLERLVNERTKELRSARERLEYVISSNPAVIYTSKPLADGSDFVLTYMSERISAMLGFEPSDFIDHPEFWERHVHPEDLRPTLTQIPRLWKDGQHAFEYRFLHKDGTYRWIREEAKVVRDTEGKPIEVNGYWTDISEHKRLMEELVKSQQLATIGETSAMVGHDLRNPLQGIAGIVYLAKRDLESRKAADRKAVSALLDIIQEQITYMDKIVSDLQDYSQPLAPKLTETNLPNLIRQTLSTIKISKGIKVTVGIEKHAENAMIDPTLMRRTLTNLIMNAIQAMPKRGKLTIRARSKRGSTVMTVEDTGAGIPRKNLAKLFSPFFTTKAKGQGLGLAVCKRLVEAQGGTITVKSRPRKGTAFTIKLPRGRTEVAS